MCINRLFVSLIGYRGRHFFQSCGHMLADCTFERSAFIRMTKVANFCKLEYNKNKALENSDFWVV